jgi:Uma2 family endonuclease
MPNTIALQAHRLLSDGVSKPGEAFALDVKLEVKTADAVQYFYPDGWVTCSELDTDPHIVRQPVLLIEVLSDSTLDYDRDEKFEKYRLLPCHQEYLLIEQDAQRLELFRKRTG